MAGAHEIAKAGDYRLFAPGAFAPEQHFYPRVLNAQIHPMVRFFMNLSLDRIVRRYTHLHPRVDSLVLTELLNYQPRYFRWSGSDLMHVTTEGGVRRMVIIETNSCPSGMKSMPLYEEHDELGGYRALLERTFRPLVSSKRMSGGLAVIYDKNEMENSGYAAAMADVFAETVHLVRFTDGTVEPRARFVEGALEVQDDRAEWHPIRCAFRYVTQRPWNRIPVQTKTQILNPVVACLAGGRNKAIAAKAYDFYNAELAPSGLSIHTPQTYWDVSLEEVPFWVKRLGGQAAVKVPYSNAGQGIYTITNEAELAAFVGREHPYEQFIVQSLIGNYNWGSGYSTDRLFHVGTIPDRHGHTYVADLRVMVSAGPDGFRPLAIYARRAKAPLRDEPPRGRESWAMLGTNLSQKTGPNEWQTETERLLLMDRKDFNSIGISLDDLIGAYIQTVLATIAIDKMAVGLMSSKGALKLKLFRSLNDDPELISEIMR